MVTSWTCFFFISVVSKTANMYRTASSSKHPVQLFVVFFFFSRLRRSSYFLIYGRLTELDSDLNNYFQVIREAYIYILYANGKIGNDYNLISYRIKDTLKLKKCQICNKMTYMIMCWCDQIHHKKCENKLCGYHIYAHHLMDAACWAIFELLMVICYM